MNSSDAVSVGSVALAARTPAMRAPVTAVRARITLFARRAVSLIHSLCRAAGTARTSSNWVRRAERSLVVQGMVGLVMFMVLVLWGSKFVRRWGRSGGGELGGGPSHVE